MKKLRNIANNYAPWILGIALLFFWELAGYFNLLPQFIIPTPSEIILALTEEWQALIYNSAITLFQALVGLIIG
ncbi:MAG TPA: ABC transporter permease, partial [Atopostipes sp.]|nr:ABC transporter permease [Atopostipes sp.]